MTEPAPPPPDNHFFSRQRLARAGVLVGIVLLIFVAVRAGIVLRHWVWQTSASIRYTPELDQDFDCARRAATQGVLNQYDRMDLEKASGWTDVAPLRMLVLGWWGRWLAWHHPQIAQWREENGFGLATPLLYLSLASEALGAVSAFLLVRLWVRRGEARPAYFTGWTAGLLAGLLLWFNPAMILRGYAWPGWELWVIPLFLLAVLLVSVEWWFTAGVLLGIASMLKGEAMIATGLLCIWGVAQVRIFAVARMLCGVLVACALVISPWVVTFIPPAELNRVWEMHSVFSTRAVDFGLPRVIDKLVILWVVCVGIAAGLMPMVSRLTVQRRAGWKRVSESSWFWRTVAILGVCALVGWPWLIGKNHADWLHGVEMIVGIGTAVLLVRPAGLVMFTPAAMGAAVLIGGHLFSGSRAWFDCGVRFGIMHGSSMVMGLVDNVAGILVADFNWPIDRVDTAITVPAHLIGHWPGEDFNLTIKTVLVAIFCVALVLCGLGSGMKARRRDPGMLLGLVGGWLVFFCFLPQMPEGALVYAAGLSCLCVGVSLGTTLLGIFISLVAFLMSLHAMLVSASERGQLKAFGKVLNGVFPSFFSKNAGEKLLSFANGTHPQFGYAVVLCGLIFVYFSAAGMWKRGPFRLPVKS